MRVDTGASGRLPRREMWKKGHVHGRSGIVKGFNLGGATKRREWKSGSKGGGGMGVKNLPSNREKRGFGGGEINEREYHPVILEREMKSETMGGNDFVPTV